MAEFILEIGTEEMPARFVSRLADEFRDIVAALFDQAGLECAPVRAWATPRRMVAAASGLAPVLRQEELLVVGPPARIAFDDQGDLTKAGQGFARTQGLDQAELFRHQNDKGEYLAGRKKVGGGPAADILPDICKRAIASLGFAKKMRWGGLEFAFGRPVRWILALLDQDILPFEIAGLCSGRATFGHRVMGPGPWSVDKAADFFEVLETRAKVVLDPVRRREMIRERGDRLAAEVSGAVVWKDELLDEVANLVERPAPVLGRFDQSYLELPKEVLLTSMEKHQKSFGVHGKDGRLLPCFLCTLNLEPGNPGLVRKGWERVLKARLEDARFFWEVDNRSGFKDWLDKLENVVFLGPLGSMGDKSRRLERLCGRLAAAGVADLIPAQFDELARAGRLAKADLVSEMVCEFDSLQGIMGGIYARKKGLGQDIAQALYEQYLPAGPDSPIPSGAAGAILSIADKADTLAGCFGLDMIPTGANDPYGLRRCALGICRIITEHDLRLGLEDLLGWAQEGYAGVAWKTSPDEALPRLMDFFGHRLRALYTGRGFDTRVVDAALGAGISDVRTLNLRLSALAEFSKEPDFEQAVLTFKRAANIIRKQGGELEAFSGAHDPDLFETPQERDLAAELEKTEDRFEELWKADDFAGLLGLLRELRPSVDAFFDHVMVMCEDQTLRLNRLSLLRSLVERLGRLADFNALQV